MESIAISLVGFSKEIGTFSLVALRNQGKCEIQRTKHDLQALDRLVGSQVSIEGFPKKPFQKLSDFSWRKDDETWNVSLSRSLKLAECWLNIAINCLSEEEKQNAFDDIQYQLQKKRKLERKELESVPRHLQQYFACRENIKSVVDIISSETVNLNQNTLFVEPSCGDGRILGELARRRAVDAVGIDLDHRVLETAQIEFNKLDNKRNIRLLNKDFLLTSRAEIASLAGKLDEETNIVVFGGPPFSIVSEPTVMTTFDYSSCNRADYPALFLLHCMQKLLAKTIVFILPKRCDSSSFVDGVTAHAEAQMNGRILRWRLASSVTASPSFYLVDREIKQPCVIQHWEQFEVSA